VPQEIIESASLDGANRFQRFFHVILPQIRPTVLVMVLLTSIQSINSVGLIFSITRGGPGGATRTAAYYLLQTGWEQGDFGTGAAVSVILFTVNITLTIAYLNIIGRRRDW
jgi:multiple sugar transport system permease protein